MTGAFLFWIAIFYFAPLGATARDAFGGVAQWIEQRFSKPLVEGSSPPAPAARVFLTAMPLKLGTWICVGSPVTTELAAAAGFEWMLLDAEHGNLGRWNLLENLLAAKSGGIPEAFVRVSSLEANKMSFALDCGASGVMVPHVSTPKQAEEAKKAVMYAPWGKRSFSGSSRSFEYGLKKIPPEEMEFVRPKLFAQIEDCEALENAEKIAESADVLFLGPYDMGFELRGKNNVFGRTLDDARKIVAEAAAKNGKLAGTLMCSFDLLKPLEDMGYTYVSISSDIGATRSGYSSALGSAKNALNRDK